MAILPFPLGAINTALSLLVMHGISVTMFRSFLNQTLPSMEASSKGEKYQITLSKPTAKISSFIPEEIKYIQQQLNNRNRNVIDIRNTSSLVPETYSSVNKVQTMQPVQQVNQPMTNSPLQSSIAASSNLIQHIAEIGKPFTGTISLHKYGDGVMNNQAGRHLNSIEQHNQPGLLAASDHQAMNSQHISSMNLPFITAGLNPNKPRIVHLHHDTPASSVYPINTLGTTSSLSNTGESYQNINAFESSIRPGSLISFQSVLSKRRGVEPVIKEISLKQISKFLERKKKKEIKKPEPFRIVCTYVFDEFANDDPLDPKLIDDGLNFCTHLNIHSLVIKEDYQVGFKNRYRHTNRLDELMKIKNRNKNLKFIISIGDQADIQAYDTICSNAQLMNRFIDSIVSLTQLYELDGVNFNFKFDIIPPDSNLSFLFKQNLMQLLQQVRNQVNRMGKPLFVISALLSNSPDVLRNFFDLKELNSLIDFVNVIGYEFHEYKKETPVASHHSALYASKDDNLAWLIKNWLNTDLDKSKLNIGLSTFGRTYNVAYNNIRSLNVPLIGLGLNNGTISYGEICKFLLKNQTTYVYSEKTQVPFAYNGYDLVAFENEKSLSVKSKYISKRQIGGVMLFALNFDDTNGECDRSDDEFNKFPLHKVVFETMQFASLATKRMR